MLNLYEQSPHTINENDSKVSRIIIDSDEGILIELEGHAHAHRGMPTAEAVRAIDIVKKLIRSPLVLFPKRFLKIATLALGPYVMQEKYMQPCARELRRMIGGELGVIVSHIIEYDSAYRIRLQAMLESVDADLLARRPWHALRMMVHANFIDDYPSVHRKVKYMALLCGVALLLPPCRHRWQKSWFHSCYRLLLPTDRDRYWLSLRTDYGPKNRHRQVYRD